MSFQGLYRLNIRTDSVVLLGVACDRLDLVVLKALNNTALNAAAVFDPFQLAAILQPWSALFQLMFHREAALITVKEFRFPKVANPPFLTQTSQPEQEELQPVAQLGEAMATAPLFHFLYAVTGVVAVAALLTVLLLANLAGPRPRRPVRIT